MISFFKEKETKKYDRQTSLQGIPHFHPSVSLKKNEKGESLLLIQRNNWFFPAISKLFGQNTIPPRRILLDDLGTFVTDLIDSKTNVQKIIQKFNKKYQLHPKEAELSIVAFLNSLISRNAIYIELPEKKA